MKRNPYPLQWPSRLPRTKPADRKWSHFGKNCNRASLSPNQTGAEVIEELARLGAANSVITSNLPSRGPEGVPFADAPKGDDPGIAVWFEFKRLERVFPCDRWRTPAENLRAIAKSIEAMRGLDRWGVADVIEGVFAGFAAALPAGAPVKREWREVLGGMWPEIAPEELAAIAKARHRRLITVVHPDAGGDADRAAEVNAALDEALAELGGP